jgi:hypothetical protein
MVTFPYLLRVALPSEILSKVLHILHELKYLQVYVIIFWEVLSVLSFNIICRGFHFDMEKHLTNCIALGPIKKYKLGLAQ